MLLKVNINIEWRTMSPNADMKIELYDKDLLDDDLLGDAYIKSDGSAEILFALGDTKSPDDLFIEYKPDLYFNLLLNDEILYTSDVRKNIHFTKVDDIAGLEFSTTYGFNVVI